MDELSRSVLARVEAGLAENTAATQATAAIAAEVSARTSAIEKHLATLNGRTGKAEDAIQEMRLRHAREDGAAEVVHQRGVSRRELVGALVAFGTLILGAAAYVRPPV